MKQIVMMQGMGLNERDSAQLSSECRRTVLVQGTYAEPMEIWEYGQRIHNGLKAGVKGPRLLVQLTFSLPIPRRRS